VRRTFLGAVVALSLAAAGCTSSTAADHAGPSSGSPSVSSSAAARPATLRFLVYGDPQTVDAYRQLADDFHDDHPDVTVRLQSASDEAAAGRLLQQQLAAGSAPDVFLIEHEQLPALVEQQRVQPLDELLDERGVLFGDNFSRTGLEAFSANSSLQCMPQDVSPLVVFYNPRLLRPGTLAVPGERPVSGDDGWTWQQFVRGAQRSSHGGVSGVYVPPRLEVLMALARSAGADLVDDDRSPTTLTTSDATARLALQPVLRLVRNPRLVPSPAQLGRHGAVRLFEDGRLAMMVGTRALVPRLREATGLHFDVLPLPSLVRPRTIAEMTGYCVSASTQHLAQAVDLVDYASGPQGSRTMAAVGGIVPANLPALNSDAFLQGGSQPRHARVFVDALRRAEAPPFTPAWSGVERQVQPLLDRMFYAPRPGLPRLLPRIDSVSRRLLAAPTPSASP
jgi:multiple sugar transport system substrate-binding protein